MEQMIQLKIYSQKKFNKAWKIIQGSTLSNIKLKKGIVYQDGEKKVLLKEMDLFYKNKKIMELL